MKISKNRNSSKVVVLYRRVSTEEQAKTGFSLEHQKDQLHKESARRNFQIFGEFCDEGYSATTLERPGLSQLLSLLRTNRGKIDYLVVTKWCRLSRDLENTFLLRKELRGYGVKVFTLEDGEVPEEPSDFLMSYLNMMLPEIDNRIRSKNTKEGILRSLKEGYFPYGSAPKGYSKNHDTSKTPLLTPNEDAPMIREMFELFATGNFSIKEIRKSFAKKGFKLGRPNLDFYSAIPFMRVKYPYQKHMMPLPNLSMDFILLSFLRRSIGRCNES